MSEVSTQKKKGLFDKLFGNKEKAESVDKPAVNIPPVRQAPRLVTPAVQECKKITPKIQTLGLIDRLDRIVTVVGGDNSVVLDNKIYACITQDSLAKTATRLLMKDGKTHPASRIPLGAAIDDLFFFEDAKTLVLSGLLPDDIELTREDLECIRDAVESFVYMNESACNRMAVKEVYEKMKDKTVYVQGDMTGKGNLTFTYLKRKSESGAEYRSIMTYLTYEHAMRKNPNNNPITACKVGELCNFFGAILVEPDEHYWIEFFRC